MPEPVTGNVRRWLRLEGGAILVLALLLYARSGGNWATFALLFLVPDLSIVGYLVGPRLGAALYNVAHSYVGPLLVYAAAVDFGLAGESTASLIWLAHIGFDRVVGFGLKYPTAFRDTHLGHIGRPRDEVELIT
jgi:hypothetical protein